MKWSETAVSGQRNMAGDIMVTKATTKITPATTNIEKSLMWTIAVALILAGIAWGEFKNQAAEHERRINELETQMQKVAKTTAQMQLFLFYRGGVKK